MAGLLIGKGGAAIRELREQTGAKGREFFPFVFTLFMVVLMGNLLGMIPYSFTYTSHIIVTFTLAIVVFLLVTILGFVKHGLHFLSFFAPSGIPLPLLFLVVPIELVAYLSRPISLSVRLFANMMAGHMILKVFAGFAVFCRFLLVFAGFCRRVFSPPEGGI